MLCVQMQTATAERDFLAISCAYAAYSTDGLAKDFPNVITKCGVGEMIKQTVLDQQTPGCFQQA
jgi:hypothetical protein